MNAQLGQFFTKNSDYILSGLGQYVYGEYVTDPFAGDGDLLRWAEKNGALSIQGFDVDKSLCDGKKIRYNDSLKKPREYDFVLTNPPYLYQNKMLDNSILADSKHTDLYQLALEKIMDSNSGIVIVPINFLSAENSRYIREMFLKKFTIVRANYFTEQVFNDTTYNVIAFYYKRKIKPSESMRIEINFFPENKNMYFSISEKFGWQIGGNFLAEVSKFSRKMKIDRLEEEDLIYGEIPVLTAYNHLSDRRKLLVAKPTYKKIKNNIIVLKAIDTGSDDGKICLSDIRDYGVDALVSLKSSRNQIHLLLPDEISISEQKEIIKRFNRTLDERRKEYNSLFMTNFRDKGRKRISFSFAYDFINYIYFSEIKGHRNVKIQQTLF
jgi:hypothetical protein